MNQSQISEIVKLTLASVRVDKTDHPVAIIPKDMQIHPLENYNDKRSYFKAHIETTNYPSFIEYSKSNSEKGAQCFIDERKMCAETIFDIGDTQAPKHAQHRVTLGMVRTAAYKALCDFEGVKHNQKTFAEWLEDWSDFLTAVDNDGGEIPLTKAIQAVRKITLDYSCNEEHEIGDFSTKKSALENVEAKSKLELPASFIFTCEPYAHLNIRDMQLRLSVIKGNVEPVLIARLVKGEQLREAIAKEFADKISYALADTEIKVNIGIITI